jgi:hypothetical protein
LFAASSLTSMLAIADTMPTHTGFASPFLPVDEHGDHALTAGVRGGGRIAR